jgi:hypothetical protein
MVKVAKQATTPKDFRHYDHLKTGDDVYTRVRDDDLSVMWAMLNELLLFFSQRPMLDRYDTAPRIKAILTRGWVDGDPPARVGTAAAPDRIELQNVEFRSARDLAKALDVHDRVAVVDDDYPEVRHKYESALRTFIEACRANGRNL